MRLGYWARPWIVQPGVAAAVEHEVVLVGDHGGVLHRLAAGEQHPGTLHRMRLDDLALLRREPAGLFRMSRGIRTFPRSCSSPEKPRARVIVGPTPRYSPRAIESTETFIA
jgi:hypothetical protein